MHDIITLSDATSYDKNIIKSTLQRSETSCWYHDQTALMDCQNDDNNISVLCLRITVIVERSFTRTAWTENNKKTLIQNIKYAANFFFFFTWVLFYWRRFDEQQAYGPLLLTWANSYKTLSTVKHFIYACSLFRDFVI